MSNTGKGKKLASFNCDQRMWERFILRCQSKGTTATATLTHFIEMYLDGSLNNLDAVAHHGLEKNGLDSRIREIVEEYLRQNLTGNLSSSDTETISAIHSRLDEIEVQIEHKLTSIEIQSSHQPDELEQNIESMSSRVEQLADAIRKIQIYLNNQPKQRGKSYSRSSYTQASTPRMKPLTEQGLASRLGVNVETLREQTAKLPPPLFVAWCKGKDSSSMGWEFNEETGFYHPAT
ncbi:hypothetical protein [Nostoc parmelioides]|uniref:Uncharacterized protein n=1 Tax=Nostoc parmelioides FACHB-3921 TaxID=2692909 RepID=A0ABR8BNE0_9NOSO|nr:hypothetical protein [Nostoc parmelioides]MBD2254819.1 hypothetical protein [Nostoc parmelioides FACHB-3921]